MCLKKLIILGGIVVLFSTLLGCKSVEHNGKKADRLSREDKVKASVVQLLEEKYTDTFSVETLERENANMAFSQDTFKASVRSENYSGSFTARVNADGTNLIDDYPRLYWNEAIESRVQKILDSVEGLMETEWKIIYVLSAQTWKDHDNLDDYLEEGDTYLDLTLTLPSDLDKATETLNALRVALQEGHVQYAVACNCGGKIVIFSEKKDQPRLTNDEIRQKLERSLT